MPLNLPPPFFVGNHLALDFLNTIATPRGVVVDWLSDGQGLVHWLKDARVIDSVIVDHVNKSWGDGLDDVARNARDFRKWLRRLVISRQGKPFRVAAQTIAPLNELLARDNSFPQIELVGRKAKSGRLVNRRVRRWEDPEELLQPIVNAAADLICNEDFRRVQSCEGAACCLIFLDRTKGLARRWCSMAVCGNRTKVEAHRLRVARKKRTSR
jgi:predicted RNA-binding Zn ribbon-like protein